MNAIRSRLLPELTLAKAGAGVTDFGTFCGDVEMSVYKTGKGKRSRAAEG
jgi:hypothetical protein